MPYKLTKDQPQKALENSPRPRISPHCDKNASVITCNGDVVDNEDSESIAADVDDVCLVDDRGMVADVDADDSGDDEDDCLADVDEEDEENDRECLSDTEEWIPDGRFDFNAVIKEGHCSLAA